MTHLIWQILNFGEKCYFSRFWLGKGIKMRKSSSSSIFSRNLGRQPWQAPNPPNNKQGFRIQSYFKKLEKIRHISEIFQIQNQTPILGCQKKNRK